MAIVLAASQLLRAVLTLALVPGRRAWLQACPNCKDALAANSEGGADLVRGYFYSILFMMGMPFTLLGAFSFSMYRSAVKKAQSPSRITGIDQKAGS